MISLALAGAVSFVVSILATPVLIKWLRKRNIGQHIREEGPQAHQVKSGTPNLGGIVIIVASVSGFVVSHLIIRGIRTRAAPLVLLVMIGAGIVGFLDDWIKIKKKHNQGLNKRTKFLLQFGSALIFVLLAEYWARVGLNLTFTRWNFPGIYLGYFGFGIFAILVIVGSSNAVNLTDGLDGLAAGSSAFAFLCIAVLAYWEFRHPGIYRVVPALDLSVVSLSIASACAGFLWWNAAPAKIIMGDTGALALGAGLAVLCLELNFALLLPIIGGLFVVETLSVVIQVGSFRLFKKRVFKMAPIHHHFELINWPESTVIVRFWIVSAIFTSIAVGIFYADFIALHNVGH